MSRRRSNSTQQFRVVARIERSDIRVRPRSRHACSRMSLAVPSGLQADSAPSSPTAYPRTDKRVPCYAGTFATRGLQPAELRGVQVAASSRKHRVRPARWPAEPCAFPALIESAAAGQCGRTQIFRNPRSVVLDHRSSCRPAMTCATTRTRDFACRVAFSRRLPRTSARSVRSKGAATSSAIDRLIVHASAGGRSRQGGDQ